MSEVKTKRQLLWLFIGICAVVCFLQLLNIGAWFYVKERDSLPDSFPWPSAFNASINAVVIIFLIRALKLSQTTER